MHKSQISLPLSWSHTICISCSNYNIKCLLSVYVGVYLWTQHGVSVHFEHRTSCNRIPPAASFRPIVKHLFSFCEHIKQQYESLLSAWPRWLPTWKSHVLVSQQKEFMLNSKSNTSSEIFSFGCLQITSLRCCTVSTSVSETSLLDPAASHRWRTTCLYTTITFSLPTSKVGFSLV